LSAIRAGPVKRGVIVKIQILGTGCPKCRKTYEHVDQALKELGTYADLEKVEDLKAIMDFGVMLTPAVAIDGEVKVVGKIPSVQEMKRLILESEKGRLA
jgi:small redox-active disulfide protein 2